jgi:hypothetical protein
MNENNYQQLLKLYRQLYWMKAHKQLISGFSCEEESVIPEIKVTITDNADCIVDQCE